MAEAEGKGKAVATRSRGRRGPALVARLGTRWNQRLWTSSMVPRIVWH